MLDLIEPLVNLSVHDFAPPSPAGPIATDGASFYWTTLTKLRSAPKAGSPLGVDASMTVIEASVSALASDATSIYWSGQDGLQSRSSVGASSPPKTLAANASSITIAVDATDLYFSHAGIFRVPLAGGAVVKLADAPPDVHALALDATSIYYRTDTDVLRLPKSGGTPTNLLHAAGMAMVLLGSKLYVDNDVGGLVQYAILPVEGGAPEVLDLGSTHVDGLTGYDGALYFVKARNAIRRVPVDGSAPSEVNVSFFYPPSALVVDSTGVYWIDKRQSCQLQTYSQGPDDPGGSTCEEGLFETLVLRLPVVF